MDNHLNWYSRVTKGPAAAHSYLIINGQQTCQVTLDWSYDGIYYKYNDNPWIILSIGPKTQTHDLDKIDTEDKKKIFKYLSLQFFDKLENYSEISNKSLKKLREIYNHFL